MMASLSRLVSGLHAAQSGLSVTGHNISNVDSEGYSRQQILQSNSRYTKVGSSKNNDIFSVGLGTNVSQLRQVRDVFLDQKYRTEAGKLTFYDTKASSIRQIEAVLGDIHGESRMSELINDVWDSMQNLISDVGDISYRTTFISTVDKFIERASLVYTELTAYQHNLNDEVINQVNSINELSKKIYDLNEKIVSAEVSGDSANDYRDERNLYLDELSTYANIRVTEDRNGRALVTLEGNDLVGRGGCTKIGFRFLEANSPFVEPVFTDVNDVLPHTDTFALSVFGDLSSKKVSPDNNNDYGSLKSLLICRGNSSADYTYSGAEVDNFVIPKIQRELDVLVNKIITMFNDKFTPNILQDEGPPPVYVRDPDGPLDLSGDELGLELFIRKGVSRYDENGVFNQEPDITDPNYDRSDPKNKSMLYSITNIMVNPDLKTDCDGLALSKSGDKGDSSIIEELLSIWKSDSSEYSPQLYGNSNKQNFKDYYDSMLNNLIQEGNTANSIVTTEYSTITLIQNDRLSTSSVSLDEEMTNMLKYQHAYNAAARMVNVIDSMIDQVISRTGRVGV